MNQARSTLAFAEFCKGAGLDARESFILSERIGWNGDKQTYEAIGNTLGTTRERVRQIEVKALRKARNRVSRNEGLLDGIRDAMEMSEFFFAPIQVITPDVKQQAGLKKRLKKLTDEIDRLTKLKSTMEREIRIGSNAQSLVKRSIEKAHRSEELGNTVRMILVNNIDMEKAPRAFRHFRYKFVASSAIVPGNSIVVSSPVDAQGWTRIPTYEEVPN